MPIVVFMLVGMFVVMVEVIMIMNVIIFLSVYIDCSLNPDKENATVRWGRECK